MAAASYFSHAITAILVLVHVTSCLAAQSATPSSNDKSVQFIKTSCDATVLYPDLCFATLSGYANQIRNSPKLLASTALSIALDAALSVARNMTDLSKSQSLKPREASALRDCVEELNDSVYELQQSVSEMSSTAGKSISAQIGDIQTWVSAALTDEDTCMDGIQENAINGKTKDIVRTQIQRVSHITSNALALFNSYAAMKKSSRSDENR